MNYDETKVMDYQDKTINIVHKNGTKRGFFGYDYRQLQIDLDWKPDENKAVSLEMKAGQCAIFWSTLMHASYPNSTAKDFRLGFTVRYVPTYVHVYPNTDFVSEYGGEIPLTNFGSVVVSGQNIHPGNRIVAENRRGKPFIA